MGVTSWDISDLESAAAKYADAGDQLATLAGAIRPLAPEACGKFVGSVAAHTEPATSTANARLVRAAGGVAADIATELEQTARSYADTEAEAVGKIRELHKWIEAGE